jgi:hypothetical protein
VIAGNGELRIAIRAFFAEVAGHRSCLFRADNRAQLSAANQIAGNRGATHSSDQQVLTDALLSRRWQQETRCQRGKDR